MKSVVLLVLFLFVFLDRTLTQEDPGDNQICLEEVLQMVSGEILGHPPNYSTFHC